MNGTIILVKMNCIGVSTNSIVWHETLFCRLEVRQVAEGVHHVPGLVEARVTNMIEAWEVLQTGSKARVVGSTNANEHSSRSHWFVAKKIFIQFCYFVDCRFYPEFLTDFAFQHTLCDGQRRKLDQWRMHKEQIMANWHRRKWAGSKDRCARRKVERSTEHQ